MYVRRHRDIALLIVTSFLVVMIGFPYWHSSRVADSIFDHGAAQAGALSAASAVGAVCMSLFVAKRAGGAQSAGIRRAASPSACGLMLLAVTPTLATALAAVFLVGAARRASSR